MHQLKKHFKIFEVVSLVGIIINEIDFIVAYMRNL